MALDFTRYLDVPVEDITAPRPLPEGHYYATIVKTEGREIEYEKGKKTPVMTVHFRLTGADDDVDPDALPEGGLGQRIATRDYKLDDPERSGQWALRRLAEETCRIPGKGRHLQDLLDDLPNQEVKVFNIPRASKRPGEEDVFYTNITKVLPAYDRAKEDA